MVHFATCRMYHHATVAVLLSRSWRVRKRAQQMVRKLLSSLGGSGLAHGLLGELRVVINKHKVQTPDLNNMKPYILIMWMMWMTVFVCCQVLPQEVLVSESGEPGELGRNYILPRVLLDALCVVCSSANQWGDPVEAENLAMEILIVTHHPSIGMRFNLLHTRSPR